MMNWLPGAVLGGVLGVSTLVGGYASVTGAGLAPPTKEPLSIREGTVRRGHTGTSYFATTGRRGLVGGGLFGGK